MADFNVKFTGRDAPSFQANMGEVKVVHVGAVPYDGTYTVTPKTEPQTLETKDKLMTDDVNVKAIPFFETSNNAGGETVYIAMEV